MTISTLQISHRGRMSFLSRPGGFVYVLCWVAGTEEIPFYVGQTNRLSARMHVYSMAHFKACTDFCVGKAIRYLRSKNYRVTVSYKSSSDPLRQEKVIIRRLLVSGIRLLNCLPRYDYRTGADENEERIVIERYCDMFTAEHIGRWNLKA